MLPSAGRSPSPLLLASAHFWWLTLTTGTLQHQCAVRQTRLEVTDTTVALYVHDHAPIPAPPNVVPDGNASLYHAEVLLTGVAPWSFSVSGTPALRLPEGSATR